MAVTSSCCLLLFLLLRLFYLISGRPTLWPRGRPLNRNEAVLIICVVGATVSCSGLISSVANRSQAPLVPPSTPPPLIFPVILSLRTLTAGSLTLYFWLHRRSSVERAELFFHLHSVLMPLVYLLIKLPKTQPDYFLGYYNSKTSRGINWGAFLLVYMHNLEKNAIKVQSLPHFNKGASCDLCVLHF